MEQDMTLYQIINILETKGFFKFTVKVIDESNLEYTFKSFKWNNMMTLKVAIIKFQKQKFIRHVAINDKKKRYYEKDLLYSGSDVSGAVNERTDIIQFLDSVR